MARSRRFEFVLKADQLFVVFQPRKTGCSCKSALEETRVEPENHWVVIRGKNVFQRSIFRFHVGLVPDLFPCEGGSSFYLFKYFFGSADVYRCL